MKRIVAILFVAVALLVCARAIVARNSEKLEHRVKLTQVNEWQAIVSCRNGRTPSINKDAVAGVVIVSCEGPEQ